MEVCGYTLDDIECTEVGAHFCVPRANKAQAFFEEILVHTKGQYTRKKFILEDWQRDDIVRPLFGRVEYSEEFGCYKRRYEIAWIELARKNGKALDVETPILTGNGWKKMGDIQVGDYVHAADGTLARVSYVSERHWRDCFSVQFADGAELVASDHHLWAVNDRLKGERVIDTAELYRTQTYGARGDRRYTVTVPEALDRDEAPLPLDPYILGAWLGDGTATRAEFTSEDPEIFAAIEAAGYPLSYDYASGNARTRGAKGLVAVLRKMGVLGAKHVPQDYLIGSRAQRLALLQGLMDTDGSVITGPNTPRVEFCNTNRDLAEAALFLARSLGWKATLKESRARLNGKDCGPRFRVSWTAYSDMSPFRLQRKSDKLAAAPARATRARTNTITSVTPVPTVETVCIQIDHPSHVFLAGKSLTPTHNTELLAGIMLYLLVADGEQSGEIYGVARDKKQAALAFDVAAQMVKFSPILSKRLKVVDYKKRIYDAKTNSFYDVIAADAKSALGSNPSGCGADEILAWQDGGMWDSLRTGMGSGARVQPLMVASTTAGNDTEGFAGLKHREMERVMEDPDNPDFKHIFVYMRNTPMEEDPWNEECWPHANPALGRFLSWEAMRKQAAEARNNPIAEMAFRQFKLNQWQNSTIRWMRMPAWDECKGTVFKSNKDLFDAFAGQSCWFGLDLAARRDLCSICYLFPQSDGSVDLLWRHWIPESALAKLDRLNDGRFAKEFVPGGWLKVTEGDVLDFDVVYDDIEADSKRFTILGGDADQWSSDPVIQEIEKRTYLYEDIFAYKNDFAHMSDSMHRIFEWTLAKNLRHHGNPLARFCFSACEARVAAYDPNLIRPDKPDRDMAAKRIDAVPTAVMATNAFYTRGNDYDSVYEEREALSV
ncbi:terminase large subunit [Mycobacterium phage MISSy]|nr:terminase large subunit [Mycobacterium phage MISSy]